MKGPIEMYNICLFLSPIFTQWTAISASKFSDNLGRVFGVSERERKFLYSVEFPVKFEAEDVFETWKVDLTSNDSKLNPIQMIPGYLLKCESSGLVADSKIRPP